MLRQFSETHLARLLRQVWTGEIWRRLLLSIAPVDGFKTARTHIIDLYAEVYIEIDEVRDAFTDQPNPQLREWAIEPHARIPDYDPHETVTALLSFPARAATWLKRLSIVALGGGMLFSANWLRSLAVGGFSLLDSIEGVVPVSILAFSIIYLWFLHVDTFAHQTLARELRVGKAKASTRRRPQIVSYGVWNRSLLGQAGLFLVGVFYLLDSLPHLPVVGRVFDDPAGYITNLIAENISLFYGADSWTGAVRTLFSRVR